MKEKRINSKQMSEILGISPQAVTGLASRGRIIRDEVGLFDLNHPENHSFLKERGIKISAIKIPDALPAGRPVAPRKQGTPAARSDETQAELKRENIRLKNEKLKADLEIINRNYVPHDFIESQIMTYITRLHTTVERLAMTSIQDYGKTILADGEVTQKTITDFVNLYLSAIHNTVQGYLAELKKFKNGGPKK